MRLYNLDGRAHLYTTDGLIDVASTSEGRFPSDPQQLYADWDDFAKWSGQFVTADVPLDSSDEARLGPPVTRPSQVFAIGLNYRAHAEETSLSAGNEDLPLVFTKFPSCVTGPYGDLRLSGDSVDWEVELVAVIGRTAHHVPVTEAWSYVAGLTVGQDYSDRRVQLRGSPAQFSLGKSFPGFGPLGPGLVSPDELTDPDSLQLSCTVNGEVVQLGDTKQMIHSVSEVVAMLSEICGLRPGDLIFTGTPEGVGMARTPARYLSPGDIVESTIEGIGTIRQRCHGGAE